MMNGSLLACCLLTLTLGVVWVQGCTMVQSFNATRIFNPSTQLPTPLVRLHVNNDQMCSQKCCDQNGCNVAYFHRTKGGNPTTCSLYACHPSTTCGFRPGNGVKITVNQNDLVTDDSAEPNASYENVSTDPNASNENVSTDPNASDENDSTDPNASDENVSTDPNASDDNVSTDPNASNENVSTDPNASDDNVSTDPNASDENVSTDPNASDDNVSTDPNASDENVSTDPNASDENVSTDPNASDESDSPDENVSNNNGSKSDISITPTPVLVNYETIPSDKEVNETNVPQQLVSIPTSSVDSSQHSDEINSHAPTTTAGESIPEALPTQVLDTNAISPSVHDNVSSPDNSSNPTNTNMGNGDSIQPSEVVSNLVPRSDNATSLKLVSSSAAITDRVNQTKVPLVSSHILLSSSSSSSNEPQSADVASFKSEFPQTTGNGSVELTTTSSSSFDDVILTSSVSENVTDMPGLVHPMSSISASDDIRPSGVYKTDQLQVESSNATLRIVLSSHQVADSLITTPSSQFKAHLPSDTSHILSYGQVLSTRAQVTDEAQTSSDIDIVLASSVLVKSPSANSTGLSAPGAAGMTSVLRTLLLCSLAFGCVFILAVVGVMGKLLFDSYKKRHYSRLDYLINGMY